MAHSVAHLPLNSLRYFYVLLTLLRFVLNLWDCSTRGFCTPSMPSMLPFFPTNLRTTFALLTLVFGCFARSSVAMQSSYKSLRTTQQQNPTSIESILYWQVKRGAGQGCYADWQTVVREVRTSMVQEKYAVRLSSEDQEQLRGLIHSGRHSARVINRARILLKTDEGWSASQVVAALDTSQRTVFRTKRRYAEEGLEGVLHDHPQANRYRKLDDRGEAHLIALACSDAPEGHEHWTLRLLAGKVVELGLVPSLSYETVRLRLKKTPSSRGGSSNGASRK